MRKDCDKGSARGDAPDARHDRSKGGGTKKDKQDKIGYWSPATTTRQDAYSHLHVRAHTSTPHPCSFLDPTASSPLGTALYVLTRHGESIVIHIRSIAPPLNPPCLLSGPDAFIPRSVFPSFPTPSLVPLPYRPSP